MQKNEDVMPLAKVEFDSQVDVFVNFLTSCVDATGPQIRSFADFIASRVDNRRREILAEDAAETRTVAELEGLIAILEREAAVLSESASADDILHNLQRVWVTLFQGGQDKDRDKCMH